MENESKTILCIILKIFFRHLHSSISPRKQFFVSWIPILDISIVHFTSSISVFVLTHISLSFTSLAAPRLFLSNISVVFLIDFVDHGPPDIYTNILRFSANFRTGQICLDFQQRIMQLTCEQLALICFNVVLVFL